MNNQSANSNSRQTVALITSLADILEHLAGFQAAIDHLTNILEVSRDQGDMAKALTRIFYDRRQYVAGNNIHLMNAQPIRKGTAIYQGPDPNDNQTTLYYVVYPGGWVAGIYYDQNLAWDVWAQVYKLNDYQVVRVEAR